MIKTLHITSIVIGILAISLLIFGGVLGSHVDEEISDFLQSPDAIEKFKMAKDTTSSRTGNQASPLVKEAKAFALYLNPPPKPEPKRKPGGKSPKKKGPKPITPVSAKFKLVGTAYYPLSPNTSMALIDQPGKGLSWVRQGEEVGHLVFEQIKDGEVIIRDGNQTREMKTPARAEDQAIEKFVNTGLSDSRGLDSQTGTLPRKRSAPSRRNTATGKTVRRSNPPPPMDEEERTKMLQELFSQLDI
ncbi:MAG: hypothetical protein ACYTE8_00135, partial [Planctomycetota bacterium]